LRAAEVSGAFVEFFGPSVSELSSADRSTVANMCPEYGALIGYWPADEETLRHLSHAERDPSQVSVIREYLKAVGMLVSQQDDPEPEYASVVNIDLGEVKPSLSGPIKAKDKIAVERVAEDFRRLLTEPSSDKGRNQLGGFGLSGEQLGMGFNINVDGYLHPLSHGTVLLAAITSCSNTSNPTVMLAAGLLAKKAIEANLSVAKYIRKSLSPGSGVVTSYLHESGVMPYFYMLGFEVVGYGCTTCVDNHRPLPKHISKAVCQGNLVCCGLLSGNRNFEGRLQPDVKANYLASPLLVIAYAIAGRINIDFEAEPLGFGTDEKPVFLRDIWPTRAEVREVERRRVVPAVYAKAFSRISFGNKHWSGLQSPEGELFPWEAKSTFLRPPLYVKETMDNLGKSPRQLLKGMRCLLKLGDNVTSDFISPAGSIVRNSPAADYLSSLGLAPRDYGSYGVRRGNCEVMMRGTFSNVHIRNMLAKKDGPYTVHLPSDVPTTVFDAAARYKREGVPLFVVAGERFGHGAVRDWATKGPLLLGIRAILAISFDATYRSSLVRAGILPVEIDRTTYEILSGREVVDIVLPATLLPSDDVALVLNDGGFELNAVARLDNHYEVDLFKRGGVLKDFLTRTLSSTQQDKVKA